LAASNNQMIYMSKTKQLIKKSLKVTAFALETPNAPWIGYGDHLKFLDF